jgi:hypothetical protein
LCTIIIEEIAQFIRIDCEHKIFKKIKFARRCRVKGMNKRNHNKSSLLFYSARGAIILRFALNYWTSCCWRVNNRKLIKYLSDFVMWVITMFDLCMKAIHLRFISFYLQWESSMSHFTTSASLRNVRITLTECFIF